MRGQVVRDKGTPCPPDQGGQRDKTLPPFRGSVPCPPSASRGQEDGSQPGKGSLPSVQAEIVELFAQAIAMEIIDEFQRDGHYPCGIEPSGSEVHRCAG